MKKIFFFAALCLMNVALMAQDYELRVLTFEDEDAKFSEYSLDYADDWVGRSITTWSDLIDNPQYGGPLTYADYMSAEYHWYDENNTELAHTFPDNYAFCYWGGGHAISNYWGEGWSDEDRDLHIAKYYGEDYVAANAGNDAALGWFNVQWMVPVQAHSGNNFAVHYGYKDFYTYIENLPELRFEDGEKRVIDHMYVTNTNYTLNQLYNGVKSEAGNNFGGNWEGLSENAWLKIIAYGFDDVNADAYATPTDSVEFYLVNGTNVVTDWQEWDLSALGEVAKVRFNFLYSEEMGGRYGFTIPGYFAYDDVAVRFPKEVVEPIVAEVTETACDSHTWNGETYTESGDYTVTLQTEQGRDSIVTLHLTINNSVTNEVTETADGEFTWNGTTYTESGDYTVTLETAQGCDSVITLHLTINPIVEEEKDYELRVLTFEDADAQFDAYSLDYAGVEISTWSDLIDDTQYGGTLLYNGAWGMDEPYWWYDQNNTEIMHVMPYNYYTYCYMGGGHAISNYASTDYVTYGDYLNQLTVYGEEGKGGYDGSANFAMHYGYMDGSSYNQTEVLPSIMFGDGVARVVDHMYVNINTYLLNCILKGNGLTAPVGENDWVKIVASGWDADGNMTGSSVFVVCEGGTVNVVKEWTKWDLSGLGEVVSIQFNITGSNDNGYGFSQPAYFAYDNVAVRFPKEVKEPIVVEYTETACDSYTWNDTTYTESGDYTITLQTIQGRDSIVTLHLTINQSATAEVSVTTCDSYTWNGETYTQSGDYVFNTTTAAGCDSVVTLHLTILPEATTENEELVLCPSELPYTWFDQTITAAGTYTATEQYAATGCDSVIHVLSVHTYVLTLPASVTAPIARTGEAINVEVPTAEIQAHIAAETWYAPNAVVAWYIQSNDSWNVLTDEPVKAGISEIVLKYAVNSDCGSVESEEMNISVITTAIENIQNNTTDAYKIIRDNQLLIIREGKTYNAIGQAVTNR